MLFDMVVVGVKSKSNSRRNRNSNSNRNRNSNSNSKSNGTSNHVRAGCPLWLLLSCCWELFDSHVKWHEAPKTGQAC